MPVSFRRFLNQWIRPWLRRASFDVQRYPAPDWPAAAFSQLVADRGAQSSEEQDFLLFCLRHASESHSQLFQDLFVRWQLGEKRGGFFVEFGAADGIDLSNSKSLEALFGWTGILAEPARIWHTRLALNRSCTIDTRCVWTTTGETKRFLEASQPELSKLEGLDPKYYSDFRERASYDVQTVSLNDLLAEHNAPASMDYLSIDTEGSELSIMAALDFGRYAFEVITVEHNFKTNREEIFRLLTRHGYRRKFSQFSNYDDWYVRSPAPRRPAPSPTSDLYETSAGRIAAPQTSQPFR
jgi:FkbM family methyltransferase